MILVVALVITLVVLAYVLYINYKDHFAVEWIDYVDILKGIYCKDGWNHIVKEHIKPLYESLVDVAKGVGTLLLIAFAPIVLALVQIAKVFVDVHHERK